MTGTSYPQRWASALRTAGFERVSQTSVVPDPSGGPNLLCDFSVEGFDVQFTLDRGEEFVALREAGAREYFGSTDILVALGRRSVRSAMERKKPEPLTDVLREIAADKPALARLLSATGRSDLMAAQSQRAEWVKQYLRDVASGAREPLPDPE